MKTIPHEIREEIAREVMGYFTDYVRIASAADPHSETVPSTAAQWKMLERVAADLSALGLGVTIDRENAFVYASIPGNCSGTPFGIGAHVDTSPDQSGEGVEPLLHRNYDGSPIRFPKDPSLTLSPADCPELGLCTGDTIITASGDTLLGADDKAGVAEIVTAAAMLMKYPQFPRPQIDIFITRDEEIGRGVDGIDCSRLPRFCYTLDGGFPGELECETFDAWGVTLTLRGHGYHPGYAKGKLVNAALAASHFAARLNRDETPERTEGREGFFHVSSIHGNNEKAVIEMIVRDFDAEANRVKVARLEALKTEVEQDFPGLRIELQATHQYPNMKQFIDAAPEVVEKARSAIQDSGLEVKERPIRGGTDGSRLSALGHPTPNIFAGGVNFHSKKEWVAVSGMARAVATVIHLARRWTE